MLDNDILLRLFECFPNSFMNSQLEFIADLKSNTYFRLSDRETEFQVKKKVIQWLSRAAFKSEPYQTAIANRRFHERIAKGINDFLGTDWDGDDFEAIYAKLGNGCNDDLCEAFINSGYDLDILRKKG
jgi:hypothetical protein